MADERTERAERKPRAWLRRALWRYGRSHADPRSLTPIISTVHRLTLLELRAWLRIAGVRRLRAHPWRTSLVVSGVALGVAAWIAAAVLSDSVMHGVKRTLDRVSGRADLQLSTSTSGLVEELIDRVLAVPGVVRAAPVIEQTATIVHPAAQAERLLVLGVDLVGSDDAYFRDYQTTDLSELRARELEFLDSTSNLLLSRRVAERLQLRVHDQLVLTTAHGARAFEVWGFIDGDGLGQAFDGSVAVMYYPSMQAAFGRGHQVDHIDVAVASDAAVDTVAERLRAALGAGFQVAPPAGRAQRLSHKLTAVRTASALTQGLAAFTGAMLIFNTLAISLLQPRRERAVLHALGSTRRQFVTLFMCEGALLGVVGSALGVLLGLGLAHALLAPAVRALSTAHLEQPIAAIYVRWQGLALGFVSGVLVASLAAMGAAQKAWRQTQRQPGTAELQIDARTASPGAPKLRRADLIGAAALAVAYLALHAASQPERAAYCFSACAALLIAGCALLPRVIQAVHTGARYIAGDRLGPHLRLATLNLPRDASRTAGPAAALLAGAALTIGFSAFGVALADKLSAWCMRSLIGDLYLTSGAPLSGMNSHNMPLAAELGDELARLEGVRDVQRLRLAEYDYRGFPVQLSSFDAQGLAQAPRLCLEGAASDLQALGRGKVLVSENFSRRFDVHRGDTLTLDGKNGAAAFEVAAVVVDYSSDIGTILLDRTTYLRHWGDDRVDTFELRLAQGVSADDVRRSIQRRYGSRYDLFVLTHAEFRAEVLRAASSPFSVLRVVELVLLVVVSLGVIKSLLASVIARAR